MGQIRAPILFSNPGTEIVGVIDSHLPSAATLADKFRVPNIFHSIAEAYESKDIRANPPDCIVVSSPTSTHPTQYSEASQKALHIFSEKP